MSMTKNVMGAGVSALASRAIIGGVTNNATATGSAQTDAYALTTSNTVFTTTASSTGAVLRSDMQPGDFQRVANYGAQTLSVYPPGTGKIQNGTASAAFSVATVKSCTFVCIDGGANSSFFAQLSA